MTKVKEALAHTVIDRDPFCIMGIDPGLKGAISFYFPDAPERVSVEDMPVVAGMVDAVTLAQRVAQLRPDVAIVELVGSMPGQGVSSTFKFGEGCGVVRGVLAGLNIPVHYASPQRWKKHFRLSADKEESRRRALELFPVSGAAFARKKDDGRAEAALIALYHAETRTQVAA